MGEGVMGVGKSGDVDGVNAGGEEGLGGSDGDRVVGSGQGLSGFRAAREDGGEGGIWSMGKIAGEAGGDGAGADDAPADGGVR